MSTLSLIRIFTIALITTQAVLADGFSLAWAREHEPHIVMQLSSDQVATIGRERKLVLTLSQRETLAKFTKEVPEILGVESLGEPDCGCCISSALWTDTNEVTIWVQRLANDKNGSNYYHEIRKKPRHFTAYANGCIFAAGEEVKWTAFESLVLRSKDGESIQLSLPPRLPEEFASKLKLLRAQKHIGSRL